MRTTTVAFSTGQAKGGSRDWERVNWVTTLWPDSTTQWTGQWGWVNKMRLSNPIVTFFPTIAALHDYTFIVYGQLQLGIFSPHFLVLSGAASSYGQREKASLETASLCGELSSANWREYLALPMYLCSPVALHCFEGIMSTLGMSVSRAVVSAHCNRWFKAVKSKWFVDTLVVVQLTGSTMQLKWIARQTSLGYVVSLVREQTWLEME